MRITIFLILSTIFSLSVNAQNQEDFADGFILYTNGDTLYGNMKLDFQRNFTNQKIKKINVTIRDSTNKLSKLIINRNNVRAYENKKGLYISRKPPIFPSEVFLKVLSEGKLPLYYYKGQTQTTWNSVGPIAGLPYENYYIEVNEKLIRIKPTKFKKQMSIYFKEDTVSIQRLDNKNIKFKHLSSIVEDYNKRNKQTQ